PGEAALQARSGHQRTLWRVVGGPLEKSIAGQRVRDPDHADVEWSYHLKEGVLFVERSQAGKTELIRLEFGVGSGKHGVTFVTTQSVPEAESVIGPSGIEHRISYFAATHALALTPGHSAGKADAQDPELVPQGRSLSPKVLHNCFSCHAA